MKVVVTGHRGFVGSHVVEALRSAGHDVFGVDLAGSPPRDIRDPGLRLPPADCVVHLAARPGVAWSVDHPSECMSHNVAGTAQVLDAARLAGIPKVVFASSSTVYGGLSPYGLSKRFCEELCRRQSELYGADCLCLRLFSVYGPRMRGDLAMVRLAGSAEPGGEVFRVRGDPYRTARDYTYAADAAKAVRLAAELPPERGRFDAFDVCGGSPVTLYGVARALAAALGAEPRTVSAGPTPAWEPKTTEGDPRRAAEVLGWRPETAFADGVAAFAAWWKEACGHV